MLHVHRDLRFREKSRPEVENSHCLQIRVENRWNRHLYANQQDVIEGQVGENCTSHYPNHKDEACRRRGLRPKFLSDHAPLKHVQGAEDFGSRMEGCEYAPII